MWFTSVKIVTKFIFIFNFDLENGAYFVFLCADLSLFTQIFTEKIGVFFHSLFMPIVY